jgi:hypothetical protein
MAPGKHQGIGVRNCPPAAGTAPWSRPLGTRRLGLAAAQRVPGNGARRARSRRGAPSSSSAPGGRSRLAAPTQQKSKLRATPVTGALTATWQTVPVTVGESSPSAATLRDRSERLFAPACQCVGTMRLGRADRPDLCPLARSIGSGASYSFGGSGARCSYCPGMRCLTPRAGSPRRRSCDCQGRDRSVALTRPGRFDGRRAHDGLAWAATPA